MLGTLLLSTGLLAAAQPIQSARIETWVQAGEPVLESEVRLNFLEQPVMGQEEVAFFGDSDFGLGIFLAGREGITERVGGRWWSGRGGLSYDGDWLAFTAFGSGPGLDLAVYRHANDTLTEIIRAGDPLPGYFGHVTEGLGAPSTHEGEIVFLAAGDGEQVIARFTEQDGLEVVVDSDTPVPDGGFNVRFGSFGLPRIADGVVAFRAGYHVGTGYFTARGDEITQVAGIGDPLPGGLPGETFRRFPNHAEVTTSAGAIAFLAEGSKGTAGIYWNVGGTLEAAVDTRTPLPGAASGQSFAYFGQPSLCGTDLVFEGVRPGPNGFDLYLLRDGGVMPILQRQGDHFLSVTPEGCRDDRVAFLDSGDLRVASLDDRIPPPQGRTYLSESYPDFRFTVQISSGGQPVTTQLEPECLADALCIGGALPGRAEVALRILGPRPNGYFWPVIGRLSPSRVEIWIEQVSSGRLRYYLLDALPRSSERLEGVIDRQGFPASP